MLRRPWLGVVQHGAIDQPFAVGALGHSLAEFIWHHASRDQATTDGPSLAGTQNRVERVCHHPLGNNRET